MSYSIEVINRARSILAQEKETREMENRRRLADAYARLPRIREIDIQLRSTMARAAQAAFRQGSDGKALLEEARRENLALQAERRELAERYFEPGYLDEEPICTHCGGYGYVGAQMCECLTEICRQEQKKEIAILAGKENFSQFRLDYYPDRVDPQYGVSPRALMEKNFRTVRNYASFFSMQSGNLLFIGSTGLGKTFLSACIARTVTDRGYSVVYETASRLFGALEQARFSGTEENRRQAARYTDCDLLIIDDLGTEMPGRFVTAALYSLLNDRLLESRPMVISTNLNVEELGRRYSPQIASRLHGSFNRLTFLGEDIRVQKNRGVLG